MLKFSFNGSDVRVVAALQVKNERLVEALVQKMTFLMTRLQQKVQGETLPRVTTRRSGKLSDSITNPRAEAVGETIVGKLSWAGGSAWYGRVFERGRRAYAINPLGTKGSIKNIRPHGKGTPRRFGQNVLSWVENGQRYYYPAVFIPAMTPHPFMAPALEEMRGEIVSGLRSAVLGVMKER